MDAALKKAVAAAKSRGFDAEVELPPEQYAAHMRRWAEAVFVYLYLCICFCAPVFVHLFLCICIYICAVRWIDGYFKKLAKHPAYVAAVEGCTHQELMVPVEEGEGGQVPFSIFSCVCICL